MKTLFTICLAFLCLGSLAQTSIKISLKPQSYYQADTTGAKLLIPENASLEAWYISKTSKYLLSYLNSQPIYIEPSQIKMTNSFFKWAKKIGDENYNRDMSPELKSLIAMYGKLFGIKIYLHEITIGMTKIMVEKCLGKPDESVDNNSTYFTSNLWVYKMPSGNYKHIYFYNNSVSSITDVQTGAQLNY